MNPEQHAQLIHAVDQLREAMLVQAAAVIYVRIKQGDKILDNALQGDSLKGSVYLMMNLRDQIRRHLREQGEGEA
jgi:hypothetical protein